MSGRNVKAFNTAFKDAFSDLLDPLLQRVRGLRISKGREQLLSFRFDAAGGTVRAGGVAVLQPTPARIETSLRLDGLKGRAKNTSLRLNGTLQFDFASYGDGKADGLFRGVMKLGGSFKGRPEIHGEVVKGRVVSLVVESGGQSYRVGSRDPRPFIAYVSTIAGSGDAGSRDGRGRSARFFEPTGVAVDDNGRVYVADLRNGSVRRIVPNGTVTTVVDGLEAPVDVGIDARGDLLVTQRGAQDVPLLRVKPRTGAISEVVVGSPHGGFLCPGGIGAVCDGRSPVGTMGSADGTDVHGGVSYVAENQAVRVVLPDGFVMSALRRSDSTEDIPKCGDYVDVAKGSQGELYVAANRPGCSGIYVLRPDGSFTVLAGGPGAFGYQEGVGSAAHFNFSAGVEFDGTRYLYVADTGNHLIRRIDVNTARSARVAGCLSHTPGFDCGNATGFRDGAMDNAQFSAPQHIEIDKWGDLYVADRNNHAVRLIRIINDPEREPQIDGFRPFALERGATTTIEVTGRNLALAQQADLGPGVAVTLRHAGSRRLLLDASVAADAQTGPRTLSITTAYGTVTGPPGLSLEILEEGFSGAQVTTIAGTGSYTPGIHDGPAEQSQFAFPAGMTLVDGHRLIVADPVEQRVRLIATKEGAAREIYELFLYTGGAGGEVLAAVLAGVGKVGAVLDRLGIGGMWGDPEDQVIAVIERALDEVCDEAGSECEWISLPWAGIPMTPGDDGGLRLQGTLFLPTDVARGSKDVIYIADPGNKEVRVVGLDPSGDQPQTAPFHLFSTNDLPERPLSVGAIGEEAALAGLPSAQVVKVAMMNRGQKTDVAGVANDLRCVKTPDDQAQPLGLPLGIHRTENETFIADPFCQTIWRMDNDTGTVEDLRGADREERSDIGTCSDGPMSFATFGAPMDVSVDAAGNIWFADAVCNSIRVIRNLGSPDESLAGQLRDYLGSVAGHLPEVVADKIETKLDELDEEFLATNRWWVITVAGSHDGDAGFVDGPAQDSRFAAPVSLTVATRDGKTNVFVSDALNKRIRLIVLP